MKIYTKTGDAGQTSLIGGTRVPKHHIRIEAYGTIDELNSYLGLLRDQPMGDDIVKVLLEIQDRLFTIGSSLASDPVKSKMKIPVLNEQDILLLEKEIDKMNEVLPVMKSFILPGGHVTVSSLHVARTVCRRAERCCVKIQKKTGEVETLLIKYLNRLSDYLFVLSRAMAQELSVEETPWRPRKV